MIDGRAVASLPGIDLTTTATIRVSIDGQECRVTRLPASGTAKLGRTRCLPQISARSVLDVDVRDGDVRQGLTARLSDLGVAED